MELSITDNKLIKNIRKYFRISLLSNKLLHYGTILSSNVILSITAVQLQSVAKLFTSVTKPMIGDQFEEGFCHCTVESDDAKSKSYSRSHEFIFECYNGLIPKGQCVNHVNKAKFDNRLANLKLN